MRSRYAQGVILRAMARTSTVRVRSSTRASFVLAACSAPSILRAVSIQTKFTPVSSPAARLWAPVAHDEAEEGLAMTVVVCARDDVVRPKPDASIVEAVELMKVTTSAIFVVVDDTAEALPRLAS